MKNKPCITLIAILSISTYWTAFGFGAGIFMKEIKTSNGYTIAIDDHDFDILKKWKWSGRNNGKGKIYAYRTSYNPITKKWFAISMSRLILNITDKSIQVDHIDGNTLNNQRSNLRACSNSQNNMNKSTTASSGFKGVYKNGSGWAARIGVNGKYINLGTYKNIEDAAKSYNEAAIKYYGEFAFLNTV